MVAPLPGAVLIDDGRLSVSIAGTPHFVLNTVTLTQPLTAEDLPAAVRSAKRYAAGCPAPWLLITCDEWLPPGAAEVLAGEGFVPVFPTTGMAARVVAPPRRAVPGELEIRTGAGEEMTRTLMDVNSHAYGMPPEIGRASIRPGLFTNDVWCAAGYVGGEAVSVAATYRVGDCLYVAWVATMPDARGKGYAEAVMRRSLADGTASTGITRTVLHATAMGQPLYTSMGYEPVTGFTFHGFGLAHD